MGRLEIVLVALLLGVLLVIFFWPAILTDRALLATDLIFQLDPLWQPMAPEGFIFPRNQLLFDHVYVFYPWKHFTMASLAQGRFPLWNPYINGGQPFLANAQSALFSPFNLISYLFPLNTSFLVTALLPLFVAGFFTYLLARGIGVSKTGSLVSMIAFSFSGPMIVWLGHPLPKIVAWLPALLFFSERALTRKSWPYSIATGVTIAIQFLAGHPETSFHMMLVWFAYCIYRTVTLHGWRPSRLVGPGIKIAAAAIIGLTASAVQLLPFLEFLWRSTILSARVVGTEPSILSTLFLDWHKWPTLITALLPQLFGTPLNGSYWYPYGNYNEHTLYAGILPLALATVSVVQLLKEQRSPGRRKVNRQMLFFLGLAVLSLGIALRFPLFNLINRLPLFDLAINERLRNVYALAVAILAGFGVDQVIGAVSLQSEGRNGLPLQTMRVTLVVIILLSLIIILASSAGLVLLKDKVIELGRSQVEAMQGHPFFPFSLEYYYRQVDAMYQKMVALYHPRHAVMYLPAVIGFFTLGLCRWLVRPGQRVKTWAVSLTLLIFLDLFLVGSSYNPTIEPEQIYPMPEAVRFLRQDTDIYRIAGLDLTLMPNSGMVYQLSDVRGYDAVTPKRYMDLFDRMEGSIRISHFWLLKEAVSPLLDLLNVKYLLTRQEMGEKWEPVYRDSHGMTIYQNRDVMPRAFVVHRVEYVGSAEGSLSRLTGGTFDCRTTVILEGAPATGLSLPDEPIFASDEVRIVRYEPERVEVKTGTTVDGFLVLTDGHDPGWRAEVDGQQVQIHIANHAFRAVALPAGEHRVTFVYDPPTFKIGLGISLLAWVGVAVAALGLSLASHRRALGAK